MVAKLKSLDSVTPRAPSLGATSRSELRAGLTAKTETPKNAPGDFVGLLVDLAANSSLGVSARSLNGCFNVAEDSCVTVELGTKTSFASHGKSLLL